MAVATISKKRKVCAELNDLSINFGKKYVVYGILWKFIYNIFTLKNHLIVNKFLILWIIRAVDVVILQCLFAALTKFETFEQFFF